jgi:hypothetical protein
MQLTRKLLLSATALFILAFTFGQNSEKAFTANQIIQRAIDSSGGDKTFDLIRNVESISQIVTSKGDTLYFSVKRMNFNKYVISTLSLGYTNAPTVYNNGKAAKTFKYLNSNEGARVVREKTNKLKS